MGLMDAITAEDRVQLKVSDLETLMKNAAKADLIFDGIRAEVPHRYMREIITGKKEEDADETKAREKNRRAGTRNHRLNQSSVGGASGHPSVTAIGVRKKGDKTCQTCDH